MCSVQLKHTDKVVRCRFFVVPDNSPMLLGMPDSKLLGELKIMCEVLDKQQVGIKLDSQTRDTAGAPEKRTNTTNTSSTSTTNNCINMPD